jgi:hypothetical protein
MNIAIDKLRMLIVEARRLDVKAAASDPDSGSNPIDDNDADVLTSGAGDQSEREFRGVVAGLNVDERAELVALLYLGRGDFEAAQWDEALDLARERDAVSGHLANYLIGTPNLPDLLEEGMATQGADLMDDHAEELGVAEENVVEFRRVRQPTRH